MFPSPHLRPPAGSCAGWTPDRGGVGAVNDQPTPQIISYCQLKHIVTSGMRQSRVEKKYIIPLGISMASLCLKHSTAVKGGSQIRYVNTVTISTFTQCVWASPFQRYHISNLVMRSKYATT